MASKTVCARTDIVFSPFSEVSTMVVTLEKVCKAPADNINVSSYPGGVLIANYHLTAYLDSSNAVLSCSFSSLTPPVCSVLVLQDNPRGGLATLLYSTGVSAVLYCIVLGWPQYWTVQYWVAIVLYYNVPGWPQYCTVMYQGGHSTVLVEPQLLCA